MRRIALCGLVLATVACKHSSQANESSVQESRKSVTAGVEYISGTTDGPNKYHAIKVDLTHPQVMVLSTRTGDRKKTVSKFAAQYDCTAAINADFFEYTNYSTTGLAAGGGETWPGSQDNATWGYIGVGLDGRAEVSTPSEVKQREPWMYSVVGGNPLIVNNGVVSKPADCAPHFCDRHPRSAVGVSQDGKTFIMLAVDGRKTDSKGMTTEQLGKLMASLGAYRAINLDGGGSTALFVKGSGVVNRPSDGSERVVANHIGVCNGNAEDQARRAAVMAAKSFNRGAVAEMVVKKKHGDSFNPSAASGTMFKDVAATAPRAAFIEQVAKDGIMNGCEAQKFCPNDAANRAQAAVITLRLKKGKTYQPPAATGTVFKDVSKTLPLAAWIEALQKAGLTSGCREGYYCPNDPVQKDHMAAFLSR